jgi:hypothetical protein
MPCGSGDPSLADLPAWAEAQTLGRAGPVSAEVPSMGVDPELGCQVNRLVVDAVAALRSARGPAPIAIRVRVRDDALVVEVRSSVAGVAPSGAEATLVLWRARQLGGSLAADASGFEVVIPLRQPRRSASAASA